MLATIAQIETIIATASRFKNAYFWQSPRTAKERRNYEAHYSIPAIEWTEGGHTYTAEYQVSCSCANIYARGLYTRDGNKTTLTTIKNSYKRLVALEGGLYA